MAHMKDQIIYKNTEVEIYINQCHRNLKTDKVKRKTNYYTIRKNDTTGMGHILGVIKWGGRWRQYVFEPEPNTMWNWKCLHHISSFLITITMNHRNKLKERGGKK